MTEVFTINNNKRELFNKVRQHHAMVTTTFEGIGTTKFSDSPSN